MGIINLAWRHHDFCAGHRVPGHEGKCRHLHGHNYRVHFGVRPVPGFWGTATGLDGTGRVLDFGVIKDRLCEWLEQHWDHRLILWEQDFMLPTLREADPGGVVTMPEPPTAENMAAHLLRTVAPTQLRGTGAECVAVAVEETTKCSAEAWRDDV